MIMLKSGMKVEINKPGFNGKKGVIEDSVLVCVDGAVHDFKLEDIKPCNNVERVHFKPTFQLEGELYEDLNKLRDKYADKEMSTASFVGVLQIFLQKAAGGE